MKRMLRLMLRTACSEKISVSSRILGALRWAGTWLCKAVSTWAPQSTANVGRVLAFGHDAQEALVAQLVLLIPQLLIEFVFDLGRQGQVAS